MCEKRINRIKKDINKARLRDREARRVQRLQRTPQQYPIDEYTPRPQTIEQMAEREAQTRVLIALTFKTVALLRKNKLIQEKITELRKETSEFVASVMRNPENRRRYLENIRLHGPIISRAQHIIRHGPFNAAFPINFAFQQPPKPSTPPTKTGHF